MVDGYYFIKDLIKYRGQTVTIFTTSGGDSGRGFTGVLSSVNYSFIRLITQIGPAPNCALGNPCETDESLAKGIAGGISNSTIPYSNGNL